MDESRKACRRGNQLKQDTRRCAQVQVQMRQEPGAVQESAFYDALTREGGEPVRMGEMGRTRKGHAALSSWVGESDARREKGLREGGERAMAVGVKRILRNRTR